MLAALALSFASLFLTYSTGKALMPMDGPYIRQYVSVDINRLSGFSYKPWAAWVVAGLAAVFYAGALRGHPFWARQGYWVAVALLVLFTPWSDGLVCAAALALGVYAAVLHRRELRRPAATP